MFAIEDIFLFMMVLARVTGLFLFVPFFSHRSLPVIARITLGSALALLAMPMIDAAPSVPNAVLPVILWMAKELSVGLMMGFGVRMIFYVLDFASHVITVEIGLMPSAEFDPSNASAHNPLGSIVYFLGLMILLSGSEYDMLRAFLRSYEVAPIGFTGANSYAADYLVVKTTEIFKVAVLMSAPLIAVNFIVNLIFAVLGKVTPKLNVFILSFPARILAGTAIFSMSVTLLAHYIVNYVDETPEMMLRFIFFRPVY